MQEELIQLKERYTELKKEYDNYRSRSTEEKSQLAITSNVVLLKSIIESLDTLFVWSENRKSRTGIEDGVLMTIRNIYNTLGQLGLSRIDNNLSFDPNIHDAIDVVYSHDEKRDDTIVQTHRNGYIFNGSLVNPAKVTVCKHVR